MTTTRDVLRPAVLDIQPPEVLGSKLSPGPGMSASEVASHQRARIQAAMIEIVGERGYDAVTVRELARLAGVSTRAFYENFGGKEECFLRTYEMVARRTAGRIVASQAGERDWQARLQLACGAFIRELDREPSAARLALVDAYSVSPAALERIEQAQSMFETMIGESFALARDEANVPPLVLEGIVAGLVRVARSRLLAPRQEAPTATVTELVEWMLGYRYELAHELARMDLQAVSQNSADELFVADPSVEEDVAGQSTGDRAVILSAVAKLAAAQKYDELTVSRIRTTAGVSRRSFEANFEGVEDCLRAVLEEHLNEAFDHASRARVSRGSWAGGMYRAIATLCSHLAHDPVFVGLCAVGVATPGAGELNGHERMMADFIRETPSLDQRPNELIVEASTGAFWGVIQGFISSGRIQHLPRIVTTLSFLLLAPVVGAPAAVEAIQREQR